MSVDIKLKTILSATALSALGVLPAYAEETKTLDTIVVTGELQQRNLQDSQTSAVVLTGDELDTSTDGNFYNIIERTPGVVARFGEKGFIIRGIDQDGISGGSGIEGTTVNISVDGAEIPSSLGTFYGPYSNWDMQQIEVLRGPQSTQKGKNALAGAIHFKTVDPKFERETKVRLDYGSNDTGRAAFAHNEPISDSVAIRISADHSQTDGWVDNPTRNEDDHDAREFTSGRIKLRVKPSDNLNMVFHHSSTKNEAGEDFVNADLFPQQRVNFSDFASTEGSEHNITGANINYNLNNNWALESSTNFYQHDYDRTEDQDQSAFQGAIFDWDTEDESISQELKFKFDNGDNIRAVAGIYYSKVENKLKNKSNFELIRPYNDTIIQSTGFDLVTLGAQQFLLANDSINQDVENTAIFGEIEFDINDKFTALAGLRYDYESRERESTTNRGFVTDPNILYTQLATTLASQTPGFDLAPPAVQQAIVQGVVTTQIAPQFDPLLRPLAITNAANTKDNYDALLPKLGLTYNVSDLTSMSMTVQQGYRAGGVQTNIFKGVNTKYKPEFTTNYEYAFRSLSEDGRTRFNGNIFYTDWKDMQVTSQLSTVFGDDITTNAGKATVSGAELLLEHRFNDSIDSYISAAYADTEFKKLVIGSADYSGKQFKGSPETTASAGSTYYITDNWVASAEVAYTGELFTDEANTESIKIKSRTLTNAKFGYEADNWAAYIYGRNLFDKDYTTNNNRVLPAARSATNPFLVRTGEPRFVGVQFNANF
jgi:outer membrane receptor protein involved in Fe transport